MITVPSCEFVGLLNDTIPFALDDPDFPALNAIRIHWDGELLHAQAHDGSHLAWSRWSPDDDPDTDAQESLTEPWGGDDDPWTVVITVAHAKELAKAYKPDKKRLYVPLQLDASRYGHLKVIRNPSPGLTAVTTTVEHQDVDFANIEQVLANLDTAQAVRGIVFSATLLSHFADVRPRGPLELTFTGPRGAALVAIGNRFTGAISPVRQGNERHLQAAA